MERWAQGRAALAVNPTQGPGFFNALQGLDHPSGPPWALQGPQKPRAATSARLGGTPAKKRGGGCTEPLAAVAAPSLEERPLARQAPEFTVGAGEVHHQVALWRWLHGRRTAWLHSVNCSATTPMSWCIGGTSGGFEKGHRAPN
ncbi:hypothetical protein GCM10012319_37370 [Comamonas sp. KCTC 72670]|nr:hypothetical protein GCM10012319_37370 [Comamonas sp. KCTC 72670]